MSKTKEKTPENTSKTTESARMAEINSQRALVGVESRKLCEATTMLVEAKANHKAAQAAYDAEVEILLKVIDGTHKTLFDQADSNDWQSEPIEALGLPPNIQQRLTDAHFVTLGDLDRHVATCSKAGFEAPYQQIAGIGPEKAEIIYAAWDRYWAEHAPKSADEAMAQDG